MPLLAVVLCGLALAGIGQGVGDVAATTLLQAHTGDAVRSRVFAAQDGAAHAAFTLAALVGGLLVEGVGARGALGVAAACSVVAVAVLWRSRSDLTGERLFV